MDGAPVIPPPRDDDDDDVAWALQTAAVQWNRGAQSDAVVWLRRAVDAAITAGNPNRTRELNRLATSVAQLVSSGDIPDGATLNDADQTQEIHTLLEDIPPVPYRRGPQTTLSDQIPIDVDADAVELDDYVDEDFPTIPPSNPAALDPFAPASPSSTFGSAPESLTDADLLPEGDAPFFPLVDPSEPSDDYTEVSGSIAVGADDLEPDDDTLGDPTFSDEPIFSDDTSLDDEASAAAAAFHASGAGPTVNDPSIPVSEVDLEPEQPLEPSSVKPRAHTAVSPVEPQQVHSVVLRPAPQKVDPLGQTLPGVGRPRPDVDAVAQTVPHPPVDTASPSEGAIEPPPQTGADLPLGTPDEVTSNRPLVDGIGLDEASGFEDLPEEAQHALVASAKLESLSVDEEVGSFAAALVTRGSVGIMPAIADVAGGVARPGDVVFTRGTLEDGIVLRVVALEDQTTVAAWDADALDAATADCPWVADELREVADRFQALGGATLGPLGERLDDSLRQIVTDRLTVRYLAPGEILVEQGKPVPGLHVVGGGRVEFLEGEQVVEELAPGEFLFAAEVMAAGKAHATARAGDSGALVLFAPRAVAHELMVSVPPLLEILAS